MKKWITKPYGYAQMISMPLSGTPKVRDLSKGMVVNVIGEFPPFEQVTYGPHTAWTRSEYMEEYPEMLDKDCVDLGDLQTPDPYDAQQYINWKGVKQVNMCGEMCIAYLLNVPLHIILEEWEAKSLPFYKRIFGGGRATGTSYLDLMQLCALLGTTAAPLQSSLPYYTPLSIPAGCICGCRINGVTGRLNGGGIGHWVVPIGIDAERCGYGTVRIYNPYPNRVEVYSWAEFEASCRTPYGIQIKEK